MLTIYTSAFARPDYVQLLAWALRATVQEPYRFVVVLQPGGLRRAWDGVAEVRPGKRANYLAWRDALPMIDGPSVILHDDCIPVRPWSRDVFPYPHCGRAGGFTLFFHDGPPTGDAAPMIQASRVAGPGDCPPSWPDRLCNAAAGAYAEQMLDGVFLHIDKGTIAAPDAPASEGKPALVAAIAEHLSIPTPEPLTAAERAVHPGRQMSANADGRGLGDMVAAGLAAVGITKQRAQAVANAFGVKDCGCGRRQAALNRIGKRLGIGGGEGSS